MLPKIKDFFQFWETKIHFRFRFSIYLSLNLYHSLYVSNETVDGLFQQYRSFHIFKHFVESLNLFHSSLSSHSGTPGFFLLIFFVYKTKPFFAFKYFFYLSVWLIFSNFCSWSDSYPGVNFKGKTKLLRQMKTIIFLLKK